MRMTSSILILEQLSEGNFEIFRSYDKFVHIISLMKLHQILVDSLYVLK